MSSTSIKLFLKSSSQRSMPLCAFMLWVAGTTSAQTYFANMIYPTPGSCPRAGFIIVVVIYYIMVRANPEMSSSLLYRDLPGTGGCQAMYRTTSCRSSPKTSTTTTTTWLSPSSKSFYSVISIVFLFISEHLHKMTNQWFLCRAKPLSLSYLQGWEAW